MKKTKILFVLILIFCVSFLISPMAISTLKFETFNTETDVNETKIYQEDNVSFEKENKNSVENSTSFEKENKISARNKTVTLVDETTDKIDKNNCVTDYEMDTSLFNVLLELARRITNGDDGTIKEFDTDVFNVKLPRETGYYNLSSTDGEAIFNDLQSGILNLTTGPKARYSRLRNSIYSISDIRGLNYLNLDNIHTIYLDNNKLTEISSLDFASLDGLTKISIANNRLNSFSFNTGLEKVNELNLSNNNLKKINLSRLVNNADGESPKVNLSCNSIEKLSDITFSANLKSFDISFNKLGTLSQEDINEINSHMVAGAKANILIQGTTDFSSLYAGDEVKIYQGDIENISAKIYYSDNSKFSSKTDPIFVTDSSEEITTIKMPAGKIRIEFFGDGKLINQTNFPLLSSSVIERLSSNNEYSIPIKSVTYKAYVNDEEVSSLKQGEDITVKLLVENIDNIPNKDDVLSSEGAKFYYIQSSANPVNSDTINITSNGTFNIFAYLTFDDISTLRTHIQVVRRDLTAITWGVIVIVIIFVVCAAIFFIIRWYREGAQVAPLSDREIYRLKKRRGTLTEKSSEDYIADLDAPRHSNRVSDQGYSDDVLQEDLNTETSYDRLEDLEDVKPTTDFPEDIDRN